MTPYVLIVMLFMGFGRSSTAIGFSQDFNDLASCQQARQQIIAKASDYIDDADVVICVPKGHTLK